MSNAATLAASLHEEHLPGISEAVADRVFAYAWEAGHASGEQEVAMVYGDLVEIVNAVLEEE